MLDAPVDSQVTPKAEIDWYRSTPWFRLISKSLAISFRSTHLIVCLLGFMLVLAGDYVSVQLFGHPSQSNLQDAERFKLEQLHGHLLLNAENRFFAASQRPFLTYQTFFTDLGKLPSFGKLRNTFSFLASPLVDFTQVRTVNDFASSLFRTLLFLSVWAFIGGIIMRRSVVELGCQTSSGWGPAFKIVRGRFLAFLWSFGTPIVGVLALAVFPLLVGLLSRFVGIDSALIGILGTCGIVISVLIGWIFAIAALGFPLAWAAIVTERRADAFDGLSRSAAYVLQKPFTVFLCVFVGLLAYCVGDFFVEFAINAGLWIYLSGFGLGAGGSEKMTLTSEQLGYMHYGLTFVLMLAYVYPISLFWTGCSASYLVLRREVDSTDFDDMEVNELAPATEGESQASHADNSETTSKDNAPVE